MSKPLKLFITYAHKNAEAKDKLITHLAVMKREGLISIWHDNEILGGDKWREEIFSTNLPNSDILLYLVSADSLASENCNKELAIALDEKIRVIPIILEDCDWKNDRLSDFQAFPDKGKPINEWQPESKGWQNVVDGIRKVINRMQSQADSSSATSEKELRVELAFQQGNIFIMFGQPDMAVKAYTSAINLDPRNANAYSSRGAAYYLKGDFDNAIKDYNTAIELKPDYAEAYNNRGNAYADKGDFDNAIRDYNTAIELKPDYAEAYNNRGAAYLNRGDFDNAIINYNTAIRIQFNYAEAYNNRGNAYADKGEVDNAIRDYNTAIELKRDYAEAYNNRGTVYAHKGEFDNAIRDYNTAIELKRDLAEAHNNRGKAWLHLQEWKKAKSDLITAKDMGMDIIAAFHNDYKSVEDFEQKTGIQLPEDIATLLTPPQA